MKNIIWLLLVVVGLILVFLPAFSKKQQLLEKNRQYERDIEDLTRKNLELAEEKRKLEEDPVYLERVAREKMGIVRDGEVIYRIEQVPLANTEVE